MSQKTRTQVLLTAEERERFRRLAIASGTSLSNWLREAGIERARNQQKRGRLDSVEKLESFFAECARRNRDRESEPDWEDVERMIVESKTDGLPER